MRQATGAVSVRQACQLSRDHVSGCHDRRVADWRVIIMATVMRVGAAAAMSEYMLIVLAQGGGGNVQCLPDNYYTCTLL